MRDAEAGEVMHPVIGAAVESERLYVAQSRLAARLLEPGHGPLVLFDVGLGAAGNALAAIRAARAARPGHRPLIVVSFERELGALALAASTDGAARLGLVGRRTPRRPRALLARRAPRGAGRSPGGSRLGDALERLDAEPLRADLVYWDPFSPKVNPRALDRRRLLAPGRPLRPGRRALHLLDRHRHPRRRCCWPASRWGTATPPAPRRRPPPRPCRRPSRPGRSTPAGWRGWPAPRPPSRPTRRSTRWRGSAASPQFR